MTHSYLNMLGLANRAQKLVLGEESIVESIRQNEALLVLIANDASDNTTKKLTDKCQSYHVPFEIVTDRQTLSQAIGKDGRVAIAVTDRGFATKLREKLSE